MKNRRLENKGRFLKLVLIVLALLSLCVFDFIFSDIVIPTVSRKEKGSQPFPFNELSRALCEKLSLFLLRSLNSAHQPHHMIGPHFQTINTFLSALYKIASKVHDRVLCDPHYSSGVTPKEVPGCSRSHQLQNYKESMGTRDQVLTSTPCPNEIHHLQVLSWVTHRACHEQTVPDIPSNAIRESMMQTQNGAVPRLFVKAKMGEKSFLLCLDTGANSSAIPATFFEDLKPEVIKLLPPSNPPIFVLDASGNPMPHSSPPALIKFSLENFEFETKFLVLSNLTVPILGMQFLKDYEIVIVNKRSGDSFIEIGHPKPKGRIRCHDLRSASLSPMESYEMAPGLNNIKFNPNLPETSIVSVDLFDKKSPLKIYEKIYQISSEGLTVEIWNMTSGVFYASSEAPLVKISPCQNSFIHAASVSYETDTLGFPSATTEVSGKLKISEPDLQEVDEEDFENILEPTGLDIDMEEITKNDPKLWIKQLEKAGFPKKLLPKFIVEIENKVPNVFAKHSLDAGCLDRNIMVIKDVNLKPGAVVRTKPYKMDYVRRTQCDRILEKLEEYNIVRKGSSEYYSPVFIISKSNNQLRMVTSYCSLNTAMKKVFYAIPDTKLVIQQIAETNKGQIFYFTQLDLSNAYSSILVEGKAQEQFALATQNNTYLVQRLLFGSQCAPAYFNEAVKKVVAECEKGQPKHIYTFFDDVTIVTGKDADFHLQKVVEAIVALGKAGFKFRADKCHYFKQQVDILGCRINRFGVMPMERHVQAIKNIQEPSNLQEAQRIQGLLNWHSHLLPLFSEKIKPITKLSMKDQNFEWGDEQRECVKWFQLHITSRIMTHFPNYNSEIYVCSDASRIAIGGIAYQIKSFDRKYLNLVEGLIVDDEEREEARQHPIFPGSGKKCPKFFDFQGRDEEILELIDEQFETTVNEGKSKLVHLCCPIAYFSRSLSKSQQLYTTLEQETMAAVSTILQFHSLLLGFKHRYFFSDSQPLLYLVKGAAGGILKFERWLQRLNQVFLHFTIIHVKGRFNFMADFLSRYYFFGVVTPPNDKLNKKLPVMIRSPFKPGQIVTMDDIKHCIRQDPGIVFNIKPTERKQIATHIELLTQGAISGIEHNLAIFQTDSCVSPTFHPTLRHIEGVSLMGSTIFQSLKTELTWENVIFWQKKDEIISNIVKNPQKFNLYIMVNGALHRKKTRTMEETPSDTLRLYIPKQLEACAIAFFHLQHHSGAKALFETMRYDYYFPQLFNEIQDFCSKCYMCMLFKAKKLRNPIPKHPYFPVKKAAVWAMDIISGFPKWNKYKSILTIVDLYSQFTILKPLRYETANEVKTILLETIFSVFPIPDLLISDNGSNLLRSKQIRQLAYYYNTGLHLTSPYSSQSNGTVEIVNRKAQTLLAALAEQLDYPWPQLVNLVMICLNSKPLLSRGNLTPFYIMYGQENTAFKLEFSAKEKELIGLPELIEQWTKEKESITKIITDWHKKRDVVNQRKPHNPLIMYAKGDFVYVVNKQPRTKKKIKPKIFRAPMMVLADYGVTVLLRDSGGIVRKHHKNHVFRCKSFDKEVFQTLPTLVKLRIGYDYTYEDLKRLFFEEGRIPPIFKKFGTEKENPEESFEMEDLAPEDINDTFVIDIPEEEKDIENPLQDDTFAFDPNVSVDELPQLKAYLDSATMWESSSDSDSEGEDFNKSNIVKAPRKQKRIRFDLVQPPT